MYVPHDLALTSFSLYTFWPQPTHAAPRLSHTHAPVVQRPALKVLAPAWHAPPATMAEFRIQCAAPRAEDGPSLMTHASVSGVE